MSRCRFRRSFAIAALLVPMGTIHAAAQSASVPGVTPVASIGVFDGDRRLVFGDLVSAAVDDRSGTLFLIDRQNDRLSAFARDGAFLAETGRSGEGPGEFREPTQVVVAGGEVIVFDPANMRFSSYGLSSSTFELLREWRAPFHFESMCTIRGDLFLLGYREGRIIHRLPHAGGNIVQSFGTPFLETTDPLIAREVSGGVLLCNSASGAVYVAARGSAPVVRRYTTAGELVWQATIPGYVPSTVTRGDQPGSVARTYSGYGVVSVLAAPGNSLVVQYFTELPPFGSRLQDITKVRSVRYDASTGRVLGVTDGLPRLDLTAGRRAYARVNDPFPRVRIYDWK